MDVEVREKDVKNDSTFLLGIWVDKKLFTEIVNIGT